MKLISKMIIATLLLIMTACSSHKTENLKGISELNHKVSKIRFDYIDNDKNKEISEQEFVTYENEKNNFIKSEHINLLIENCDKNGDHQISLDELPKQNQYEPIIYEPNKKHCSIGKSYFQFQDINNDGILTFEELKVQRPVPVPMPLETLRDNKEAMKAYLSAKYKKCDIDSDDKLSLKEATSTGCNMPSSDFKEADINHDEFLTLAEILEIATKKYDERPLPRPMPLTRVIPPTAPLEIKLMMSMQQCDTNKDQKISEAELTSESCGFSKEEFIEADHNKDGYFSHEDMKIFSLLRNFKRLDSNKDGSLSFEEFKKNSRVYY